MRIRLEEAKRAGGCEIERWSFSGKEANIVGWCKAHNCLVRKCAACGDFFHTKRHHTKTCSDKCRKALSRKTKKKRVVKINTKAGVVEQEVFW